MLNSDEPNSGGDQHDGSADMETDFTEASESQPILNSVSFSISPRAILPSVPAVFSWGRSDFGNLICRPHDEPTEGVFQFNNASSRTFLSIASNVYHSAAVTATGELYTCGENYEGQLGRAPSTDKSTSAEEQEDARRPRILEVLSNQRVTAVSCGLHHTVCVTASRCAISFGGNECGQLGHSSTLISKVPPKIVSFSSSHAIVKKAVCGDLFTLFLTTSGEVHGCVSASYL